MYILKIQMKNKNKRPWFDIPQDCKIKTLKWACTEGIMFEKWILLFCFHYSPHALMHMY